MAKKGKTNWLICLNKYCKLIQVNKLTYFRFLPRTEQAAVVESPQQAAVVECAQELRRVGDLLDWKYRLLELIITLQKKQTGGKRWNRQLLGRNLWILNKRRPSISRGFISRRGASSGKNNKKDAFRDEDMDTMVLPWIISGLLWAIFISGRFLWGGLNCLLAGTVFRSRMVDLHNWTSRTHRTVKVEIVWNGCPVL